MCVVVGVDAVVVLLMFVVCGCIGPLYETVCLVGGRCNPSEG